MISDLSTTKTTINIKEDAFDTESTTSDENSDEEEYIPLGTIEFKYEEIRL